MKKLLVRIPFVGRVTITQPQMRSFSAFLSYLQMYLVYAGAFTLPLLYFFENSGVYQENIVFYGFLYFVALSIGLYLARVALFGNALINDPQGFIVALVFALLTTTSSISIDSPSTANTFGTDEMRALSGIFIMSALGLYYVINAIIWDKNTFKRTLFTMIISFVVLTYIAMFNQILFDRAWVLLLSIPLFVGFSLTFKRVWFVFATFPVILLLGLYFLTDTFNSALHAFFIEPSILVFSLLLILTLVLSIVATHSTQKLQVSTSMMIGLFKQGKKKVSVNGYLIYQALLLLLVPVLGFIFIYQIFDNSSFNDQIVLTRDGYTEGWELISDNTRYEGFDQVQNIVFGFGSDQLNISQSLFANVLVAQGLLGVVAYLILFGFGIYFAIKQLNKALAESEYFPLILALSIYMIGIPLLGLFVYPGIIGILFWWISFGLLTTYDSFKQKTVGRDKNKILEEIAYFAEDMSIAPTSFNNENIGKLLRILITLFISLLVVILIYQLWSTIGEV